MERREFIQKCCITALGAQAFSSCTTEIYEAPSQVSGNESIVKKSEFFYIDDKGQKQERKFLLIKAPAGRYPICIFKTGEDKYSASLMSCTHQACQTIPFENSIICPCHGARFTNTGKVTKGPATTDLVSYKVRTDAESIYIGQ